MFSTQLRKSFRKQGYRACKAFARSESGRCAGQKVNVDEAFMPPTGFCEGVDIPKADEPTLPACERVCEVVPDRTEVVELHRTCLSHTRLHLDSTLAVQAASDKGQSLAETLYQYDRSINMTAVRWPSAMHGFALYQHV